jgi:hypothetical protein
VIVLPPGWEEQRPLGAEHARWCYRFANAASITATITPKGVQIRSGPGLCHPATTDPRELWRLAEGIAALGDLIASRPEPELAEQPTLFEGVTA